MTKVLGREEHLRKLEESIERMVGFPGPHLPSDTELNVLMRDLANETAKWVAEEKKGPLATLTVHGHRGAGGKREKALVAFESLGGSSEERNGILFEAGKGIAGNMSMEEFMPVAVFLVSNARVTEKHTKGKKKDQKGKESEVVIVAGHSADNRNNAAILFYAKDGKSIDFAKAKFFESPQKKGAGINAYLLESFYAGYTTGSKEAGSHGKP